MYLKSIEIQGFKSFAHKFTFEFHNGITAIVGPNGSGKSNIADAVRWVLGEQSAKQLRGEKMEDVIFSGTETRRPLSYAYVAITFNNEDNQLPTPYGEVSVARRVYRSGESEYLMNGARCQLKAVREIFLDTGIGKEGYSIIGQGQIERILSGKPEERRELFDEAAGIVKHKKRKKEAQKDLENGRRDMQRLRDVLTEMEKQIGPLKNQSEKAREYLRLKERLKILDVKTFLSEYARINEDKEKAVEGKLRTQEERKGVAASQEEAAREFERLERDVAKREEQLEGKRAESGDGKVAVEKLEGDVKVCQAEIESARQNKEQYEERLSILEKDVATAKEECERYERELEQNKEKLKEIKDQKQELEDSLQANEERIKRYKREVSERSSDTIELLNDGSRIKAKQQEWKTLLEQNDLKKTEWEGRLLRIKSDEETARSEMGREEASLRQIEEQIRLEKERRVVLERDKERLEAELKALSADSQDKRKQYHIEKTKLDSLKNILERYDGYGHSVKRIMERKKEYPGVIGVVADVLNVKKTYETAVEIALGGSVQNVVTDTEKTAKACIEYLKKNKYGRATFLPLTNIKGRRAFQSEVEKEPAVMGILSDLVEYEPEYKGLVEYLLGRFLLVKDMDDALALARKYRHTLRIVTLEGELLNPGGSLSGGTYRNASNLIGRRREITEIEKRMEAISQERKEKESAIERIQADKEKKEEEASQCGKAIRGLQLEENTIRVKYEQTLKEMEQAREEKRLAAEEGAEIERQRESLRESLAAMEDEWKENEKKRTENEARIGEQNERLKQWKEEDEALKERAQALQLEYSSCQQGVRFLEENQNRVKQEWERAASDLDGLAGRKGEAERKMEEKKEEIKELKETIRRKRERIETLDRQIEKEALEKEELSVRQKKFMRQKDELSKAVFELDKEVARLANQVERLNEQLQSKSDYMWEEYEMTPQTAKEFAAGVKEEMEPSRREKESRQVRERIRSLGDVNVNAIEDYKNLSERYEKQKKEHDDVVEADKKLVGVIEELEKEMRGRFTEKMKEINEQFNLVFRELFGGGKGSVVLDEEEDVLDAEIRIVPQLPGKKLQSMRQLSGGEKALTAISVLFAIQNLKPSPFCLLDEIEAALDDSNIKRFAKYLHKLKKHTQFIIITHRQGTMEAADALYGITMQEKGISTMVSVQLIEEQINQESKLANQ